MFPTLNTVEVYRTQTSPGADDPKTIATDLNVADASKIVGVCRSQAAITLRIEQGYDPGEYDVKTDVAVAGAATEGGGASFSVEVVAPYLRIIKVGAGNPSSFRLWVGKRVIA